MRGASMRNAKGQFLKGTHWRPHAPHREPEWLREQYVKRGRSAAEIGADAGVTAEAVTFWLKKHGIPRRTTSEARALKHWGAAGKANPMHGRTGAANPGYVDGSSPERQRLYVRGEGRAFLRAVLERDNYRCRRCSAEKAGRKSLHVHHLRPWAGNPALRFDQTNALTLCQPCHSWVHSKANGAREFLA